MLQCIDGVYFVCFPATQVILTPHLDVNDLTAGQWLLHSEDAGVPHACAVQVTADGSCEVYDRSHKVNLHKGNLLDKIQCCLDRKTVILFKVTAAEGPRAVDYALQLECLLDTQAGAGDEFDMDIEDIIGDGAGQHDKREDDHDDAEITIRDDLLQILGEEVNAYKAKVLAAKPRELDGARCPLCPWKQLRVTRRYNAKRDMLAHIASHHTRAPVKRSRTLGFGAYVASGLKQSKVIHALFDYDRFAARHRLQYLAASAAMMRRSVLPGLPPKTRGDRGIVLLLDSHGPTYANRATVSNDNTIRSHGVRGPHYTRKFAEGVLREAILEHGRLRPLRLALLRRCLEAGNELSHLLPTFVSTWLSILEDIMQSPMVTARRASLMQQCIDHQEFTHVCLDATLRCCMRIKGQANYRKSKEVRENAPVPDATALRRVLTARGRTGACLGMWPIRGEAAPYVADCLRANVPQAALQQIVSVSSDMPSHTLSQMLRKVCPSLQYMSLDPVHLVIVYNQAHGRKRTPGQAMLRRIQNKFNKVDDSKALAYWGPPYTGEEEVTHPRAVSTVRARILDGELPVTRARAVLRNLQDELPWYTVIDYVEALAALACVYYDEMNRKTFVKSRTLFHIAWAAASPERTQWYFNNIRHRRAMAKESRSLLGSGTSPNEAIHSEINRWFRNQPELYSTTLALQLDVNALGKLMSHNAALYKPTLRQMNQQTVISSLVTHLTFSSDEWLSFCSAPVQLPGRKRRAEISDKVKAHAKSKSSRVRKRPSKRTVFTLKRIVPSKRAVR